MTIFSRNWKDNSAAGAEDLFTFALVNGPYLQVKVSKKTATYLTLKADTNTDTDKVA
jgi:hypothetical protein